jgi:hypothetical protein
VSSVANMSVLDRYRLMGLPEASEAGCAARELFDHGRGAAAFDASLYTGQMGEP